MDSISQADFDVDQFMRISAGLVRKLGSANDALVLSRIVFRCALNTALTHEHDGRIWWAASLDDLAEETGLTKAQARGSIARLIDAGLVVSEEHRLEGSTDRTKSYRPVVPRESSPKVPKSDGQHLDVSPAARLTDYQEDQKKGYTASARERIGEHEIEHYGETTVVTLAPTPAPSGGGLARIAAGFERAWEAWPKKVDRKDAERRFREAIRKVPLDDLVDMIRAHGAAYAAHRSKVYTPGLATWLHRERWTDELVEPEPVRGRAPTTTPTERARDVIERGVALDQRGSDSERRVREIEELRL